MAGVLVAAAGWRSLFLATAGAGLLALLLGMRTLRESRDPQAASLDRAGAASFTAALSLLTYGLLQAPASGWNNLASWGLLGGAALLLAVFVLVEKRHARPMLDLSLFRLPAFAGVQLLAAAPAFSFVVLPGAAAGALSASTATACRRRARCCWPCRRRCWCCRCWPGWRRSASTAGHICSVGLLLATAGLLWLAECPPGTPKSAVLGPLLLIGAGISLPWV